MKGNIEVQDNILVFCFVLWLMLFFQMDRFVENVETLNWNCQMRQPEGLVHGNKSSVEWKQMVLKIQGDKFVQKE